MFFEIKRTALLLCDGNSRDEIVRKSMDENIYQLETPRRRREVPVRMLKRLSAIDQPLVEVIAHGSDAEAKLMAFLALAKADRLLFEYMHEVYADNFRTGIGEITDKDFLEFIERKAQNSANVAAWSQNTLSNVRSGIKSSVCDAGLAKRTGGSLLIRKPIVDGELRKLFCDTDSAYLKAMLLL